MAGTVNFYFYKGLHYIFRTKIINNFKAFKKKEKKTAGEAKGKMKK